MKIWFLSKQISKAGVIEGVIVILVLSIISAVMFPRFMRSQTMVRINHNEKELHKLLEDVQNPDFKVTGFNFLNLIKKHTSGSAVSYIYSGKIFKDSFPDYSFMTIGSDIIGFTYLGYDHFGEIEDVIKNDELPLGVFYITNHKGKENNAAEYFIPKTVSMQENLGSGEQSISNQFRVETIIVTQKSISLPNPKMYFSATNGLDSTGMIYFDNQGRSWRDGQL